MIRNGGLLVNLRFRDMAGHPEMLASSAQEEEANEATNKEYGSADGASNDDTDIGMRLGTSVRSGRV